MSVHPYFEYLIFDLDGVLIDSSPCHRVAYQMLWDKLGIHGPEYDTIAGKRTVEVVSTITRSLEPTEAEINEWVMSKQKMARQEMKHDFKVCSGAVEIINKLHADGWRMSVATGASRESAVDEVVVVVSPDGFDLAQEHFCDSVLSVKIAVQEKPTGMLGCNT